jgi:hypothetical protein
VSPVRISVAPTLGRARVGCAYGLPQSRFNTRQGCKAEGPRVYGGGASGNGSLVWLPGEPRGSRYRSRSRRRNRRCRSRRRRRSRRYRRSRAIVLIARVLRVAGTVVFAASTEALRSGVAVRVHVPVGVRVGARRCRSHRRPARRSGQCGHRHETHERLLHWITPIPLPYWACCPTRRSNRPRRLFRYRTRGGNRDPCLELLKGRLAR